MDKHYLLELLQKYHNGEATKEEQIFLLSYYNLFDNELDVLEQLSRKDIYELKSEIHNTVWTNISVNELVSQPKSIPRVPVKRSVWITGIAAAVVVAVCSLVLILSDNKPLHKPVIAQTRHKPLNRLVHLPDGSTVMLNVGSKLNYPASFDGLGRRDVYLEGEAYFDIKHNALKPFVVHTGKFQTVVLGTAFNVRALPNESDIVVTVTRGKVKVSHQNKTLGVILPHQQITCSKQSEVAVLKRVNTKTHLSWQSHDLLFDDVTVTEAAALLEERFNITVAFSDQQVKSNRFTTTFLQGETLEQVLNSICEFNGAVYTYSKEKALVMISKKQYKP